MMSEIKFSDGIEKIKEDYKKIIELYDTNFKKVLSKIRKIHGDEKILSNPKVIDILKAE